MAHQSSVLTDGKGGEAGAVQRIKQCQLKGGEPRKLGVHAQRTHHIPDKRLERAVIVLRRIAEPLQTNDCDIAQPGIGFVEDASSRQSLSPCGFS